MRKNNEEDIIKKIFNYLENNIDEVEDIDKIYFNLNKLGLYLKEIGYVGSFLLNKELLTNLKLNKMIFIVVEGNIGKIKENKLSDIISDENILSIIETYAVKNNILGLSEDKDLLKYENVINNITFDNELKYVYFSEIDKILLTKEDERILGHLLLRGSVRARNILIERNLKLVVCIAKKYLHKGVDFLDIVEAGNVGLILASEKFDITKGYKFSTYAKWWINYAMEKELELKSRNIRLPEHVNKRLGKITTAVNKLGDILGRKPTIKELATYLDEKEEELTKFYLMTSGTISYSLVENIEDYLVDYESKKPEDYIEEEEIKKIIDKLLPYCTDKQRYILKLRYGFYDNYCYSYNEIASFLKISRQAVKSLEESGFKNMLKNSNLELLLSYSNFQNKANQNIKKLLKKS